MTKWTACSLADWDMEASLQRLCTGQAFVSLPRINICYCCRIIGRHEAQAECGENAPSALVAAQEKRVAECPGGQDHRVAPDAVARRSRRAFRIFADKTPSVRVLIPPRPAADPQGGRRRPEEGSQSVKQAAGCRP